MLSTRVSSAKLQRTAGTFSLNVVLCNTAQHAILHSHSMAATAARGRVVLNSHALSDASMPQT